MLNPNKPIYLLINVSGDFAYPKQLSVEKYHQLQSGDKKLHDDYEILNMQTMELESFSTFNPKTWDSDYHTSKKVQDVEVCDDDHYFVD